MRPAKVSSIVDELDRFVPESHKYRVIEARAVNAISSAVNVLELIDECFGEDESEDLMKKMILAIRSGEPKKFINKLRLLESKNED